MTGHRRPWIVGVSGASGTPYAATLLRAMLDAGEQVDLVVSQAARLTILDETGIHFRDKYWRDDVTSWIGRDPTDIVYWSCADMAAGPSSGSYLTKGMIVIPATTASIAGVALGISKDLLQRAADVTLKERRPLMLVLREAPLRPITLEHLLNLSREGATVIPASPAFYAGCRDVQQLVDFLVGKVLDLCQVEHDLYRRWTGQLGAGRIEESEKGTATAQDPVQCTDFP